MSEPSIRIERRVRFVDGKAMEHSDVFIEHEGRSYYSRYWWLLTDGPHTRAAEIADFKRRRARFGEIAA